MPLRILFVIGFIFCLGCSSNYKSESTHEAVAGKAADRAEQSAQPRKIIYTARLELVVDDLDKTEEQINQLVQAQGGYLAKSDLHGSPGSPRTGTWTVRVPIEHFHAFMDAAGKLGELRGSNIDSDDITDKYYDLSAHLKNNKVEEEALQKLLIDKAASGKLDEILAVRRELRSLRGEIDNQQGQIQRWDKETALATVTLTVHARKDYVPPTAPGLWSSMGQTFEVSLAALQSCGRWLLLAVVAILPWLGFLIFFLILWRLRARRAKSRMIRG